MVIKKIISEEENEFQIYINNGKFRLLQEDGYRLSATFNLDEFNEVLAESGMKIIKTE